MAKKNPKVFISHASDDKERFVTDFATKLIEHGIDAWYAEWEIRPGDSLVDKIFEEGIKDAQAMIIVLSNFSVQKPWVREELNAGIVKRITGQCKLIPVLIDECEVPESLQSTAWQRIGDINQYDQELSRIVSSIYERTDKPPLGTPPSYAQLEIDSLPGLNQIDNLVLKAIGDTSLESERRWLGVRDIEGKTQEIDISEDELYESIEILANNYFIDGQGYMGSRGLSVIQMSTYGFETYADAFLPGFDELVSQALIAIVNHDLEDSNAVAKHLNESRILTDYVLDILVDRNFIKISKVHNLTYIDAITVEGNRAARNLTD